MIKKARPNTRIVVTEPEGAALLSGHEWKPHKIQGWTPDFVPAVLDREVYDEIVDVAPGEISSEARGLRKLMREVRDADLSDASEFGRLIVRLTDESDEAEAFNAYVETHCGVSLRTTSSPTTTAG